MNKEVNKIETPQCVVSFINSKTQPMSCDCLYILYLDKNQRVIKTEVSSALISDGHANLILNKCEALQSHDVITAIVSPHHDVKHKPNTVITGALCDKLRENNILLLDHIDLVRSCEAYHSYAESNSIPVSLAA